MTGGELPTLGVPREPVRLEAHPVRPTCISQLYLMMMGREVDCPEDLVYRLPLGEQQGVGEYAQDLRDRIADADQVAYDHHRKRPYIRNRIMTIGRWTRLTINREARCSSYEKPPAFQGAFH